MAEAIKVARLAARNNKRHVRFECEHGANPTKAGRLLDRNQTATVPTFYDQAHSTVSLLQSVRYRLHLIKAGDLLPIDTQHDIARL